MPQYSSYFRNNIRRERIPTSTYSRTISVSLTDYGTISPTNYEANGDLFKKVYSDIISRVYDFNVRVIINVPAGDYFFRTSTNANDWNTLQPPQGAQLSIVGAAVSGTRPAAATLLAQTRLQNYTSLATYHQTRFHFERNGFNFVGNGILGYYVNSGFENIGFFGSWGGAPGTLLTDALDRKGISGNVRLESCSIFGFDGGLNSCGVRAETGSAISGYNITVCNCRRGIYALGGNFATTNLSTDYVVNYNYEGIIATGNSYVELGDNAQIRSNSNTGYYSVYAFDSSAIKIRNATVSGGLGSLVRDTSVIHTTTGW